MKLSLTSAISVLILSFFSQIALGQQSNDSTGNQEASVMVPVSPQEAAVGGDDPYGEKFDTFIFSKYPDLKKVKFIPDADMKNDEDSLNIYKSDFYRGLFFAKQIKLADGKTLFDLVTKCGKNLLPPSGAQRAVNEKFTYGIQFFPVFRVSNTKKNFEEQILLVRIGDKVIARSPLFSSSILNNSEYMKTFGVECIK